MGVDVYVIVNFIFIYMDYVILYHIYNIIIVGLVIYLYSDKFFFVALTF